MTDGYPTCRLATVAFVQGGFAFKSGDFQETGVPVLKIKNVRLREVDTAEPSYVDQTVAKETARYYCKTGDLLISMTGSGPQAPNSVVGRVARFTGPSDKYLINQRVGRFVNKAPNRLDKRYLFYVLAQDETLWKLVSVATGSANQANISGAQIENLELPLPPLAEQEAIAAVLGALDDKIELNRRMNATLEAMARALFQSWFIDFDPVRRNMDRNQPSPRPSPIGRGRSAAEGEGAPGLDFDPVRAKLDGRPTAGLDQATVALFPDSFQDSSLGHIPKGWEVGSILRQADLLSGGTPKTDVPAYWNGDFPWASAKDVSQCREAFLVSTERTITKQGVEESSTKIIPEFATVVVARGATTGRLTMFGHSMAMNQTCYGLRSKVSAPFSLYCHARHFIERLVQGGHGSIFDTITTSTFEATDVLLAPKEVLFAFDKQVMPLFQQLRADLHQSRTLATLRDTLLPKLLSGELCVTDSVFV